MKSFLSFNTARVASLTAPTRFIFRTSTTSGTKWPPDKPSSSNNVKPVWCFLDGFRTFSSRKDLELELGDIKPIVIDPIIGKNMYPSGRYLLQLENMDTYRQLSMHLDGKLPKRFTIGTTEIKSIPSLTTASSLGISNCTIRVKNISRKMSAEDIRYYFEEYKIKKINGIVKFGEERELGQYWIHFESCFQAERAVSEKNLSIIDGHEVNLMWYHC